MLANGVDLDFDTPRETVIRMAHDRMQAAERVKVAIFTQGIMMVHGAVAAMSEGSSSDASTRLKDLVSTYHDLMSPERVSERKEAVDKGRQRLEAEEGKGYRMARVDGKADSGGVGGRKGGLLRGRRKKPQG